MARLCGIYSITNTKNSKRYIGQSINIKSRISKHKSYLRKGTHINKHLQRSYNKHGEDNFKFEIIQECEKDQLDKYEIELIKKYDTTNQDKGYNHEHGGHDHKRASLESKIKRRGKWAHSINSKTLPSYIFRNMFTEIWNTFRNYENLDYSTTSIALPTDDINQGKEVDDYITVNDGVITDNMTDYEKLIKKYYKADGKNTTAIPKRTRAERVSSDFAKNIRRETARRNRHLILDELLQEAPFDLNKDYVKQIRYWIDTFNEDFKSFHRRSKNETIILAFMLMYYKQDNPNENIYELDISKKYELTEPKFLLIQNRVIFRLMSSMGIQYRLTERYSQDILQKGENKAEK